MKSRKLGYIRMTTELIMNEDMDLNRCLLFKSFHPYHIETCDTPGQFKYYGISEFFSEVEEGGDIPQYRGMYECTEDNLTFKFERV